MFDLIIRRAVDLE